MTEIEKRIFLSLYNRGGYVLDFNTDDFDCFTQKSVGEALCSKYKRSKGKSLTKFCNEAKFEDVKKLLYDLLEYYEAFLLGKHGEEEYFDIYNKCKRIKDKEIAAVKIVTPAIDCVNRDYIVDISERAIRDINNNDYDSAITKARTLIEEVFCHAIESKKEKPSDGGDIGKLYGQVKTLYHMHSNQEVDKRINMLLSGLEKILTAITQMRNKDSDAHGVGERRVRINEHHARLFVNSAMTMADFILSVEKHSVDNANI